MPRNRAFEDAMAEMRRMTIDDFVDPNVQTMEAALRVMQAPGFFMNTTAAQPTGGKMRKPKTRERYNIREKDGQFYCNEQGPFDTRLEAMKAAGYKSGEAMYEKYGLQFDVKKSDRQEQKYKIYTPDKEG